MSTNEFVIRWIDLDTFATRRQLTRDAVLDRIHAGTLTGLITRSGWYVLEQLVALEIPEPDQPEAARLHVTGKLTGEWLTVCGSESVVLDLVYDETIRTAIGALYDSGGSHGPSPVTLSLNGQRLTVDVPLQADLISALLEWQIEVELGELLKEYRSGGPLTH